MRSHFQQRHYEAIAALLRSMTPDHSHAEIVLKFAKMLGADNPRFDRERFLKAAGVVEVGERS